MRAILALAILLLALASGALAMPPKDARFSLDNVEYIYVTGVNFTETVVLESADPTAPLPIESCAFVMLHPGTPNGRIIVHSLQSGGVPATLYIDQFRLPTGKRGYSYDSTVSEDGLTRIADVAVSGNATLRVASERYYDPVGSSGIEEFDKDTPDMLGTMRVLQQGVRDDVTQQVLAGGAEDDTELHVHLRSNPDAAARDIVQTFASPGIAPPTEAYGAMFKVANLKYGGQGTLDITTTAYAPQGMNTLHFSVVDPRGKLVANTTLAPALLTDDTGTLTFPLDLFGDYTILVGGSVALATYEMTLTMAAPPALDLHFWWDNVTYGYQAYQDYRACTEVLGSPNAIVGVDSIIGRPDPPRINLPLVGMGIAGAVAAATVLVKLASDQVSLGAFRKGR